MAVVASSAAHPIGATELSVSDEFELHETSGMFDVRTGCDAPPARWRSRWPRRSETRRSVRPADADAFPASVARYCGVELSAIVSRPSRPTRRSSARRAGRRRVRGARVEDEELVEHRRVDGAASVGKTWPSVGRSNRSVSVDAASSASHACGRLSENDTTDGARSGSGRSPGSEAGGGGDGVSGGRAARRRAAAAGGAAAAAVHRRDVNVALVAVALVKLPFSITTSVPPCSGPPVEGVGEVLGRRVVHKREARVHQVGLDPRRRRVGVQRLGEAQRTRRDRPSRAGTSRTRAGPPASARRAAQAARLGRDRRHLRVALVRIVK